MAGIICDEKGFVFSSTIMLAGTSTLTQGIGPCAYDYIDWPTDVLRRERIYAGIARDQRRKDTVEEALRLKAAARIAPNAAQLRAEMRALSPKAATDKKRELQRRFHLWNISDANANVTPLGTKLAGRARNPAIPATRTQRDEDAHARDVIQYHELKDTMERKANTEDSYETWIYDTIMNQYRTRAKEELAKLKVLTPETLHDRMHALHVFSGVSRPVISRTDDDATRTWIQGLMQERDAWIAQYVPNDQATWIDEAKKRGVYRAFYDAQVALVDQALFEKRVLQ